MSTLARRECFIHSGQPLSAGVIFSFSDGFFVPGIQGLVAISEPKLRLLRIRLSQPKALINEVDQLLLLHERVLIHGVQIEYSALLQKGRDKICLE